ncbi:AN1-type zinc finger protein 1 [Microbotryomycetes sp. JL201]|nr:AN1-type zinc finger protein 1 [Microbotryomycetes sp. JL201]
MSADDPPLQVGTHCAQESCHKLDFLPHRCSLFNDLLPDPKRKALDRGAQEEHKRAKTDAARAVLAKNFGAAAVAKLDATPQLKRAPAKVNSAIALMKLKQRAKPVDHKMKDLKVEDRLYLTVELRDGSDATVTAERELYISKAVTVGRALDLFADVFGVANSNNTTTDSTKAG